MKHSLRKIDLHQGAKLLIINLPGAKTISFDTLVRGGFRYAPRHKIEMPHLLEHLAFCGNKIYPTDQIFAYEIEKRGVYANAYTYDDVVWYVFDLAPDALESVTKLALAQLSSPNFKADDVTAQKSVVANELTQRLDSEFKLLTDDIWLAVEKDHQLNNQRIKQLASISKIDLENYFKDHYVSGNMWFMVCGDLSQQTQERLITQINEHLKLIHKGPAQPIKEPQLLNFGKKLVARQTKHKAQTYFYLDFISPFYHPEDASGLRIFDAIYNEGFGSRMFLKSRQAGLNYGLSSGYSLNNGVSAYGLDDRTPPEHARDMVELALKELAMVRNGEFSEDELSRALGYIRGSMRRNFLNANDYAGWYGKDFAKDRTLINIDEYIDDIIQIDKQKIVEIAHKYVKADNWILGVAANDPDKVGPELHAIASEITKRF